MTTTDGVLKVRGHTDKTHDARDGSLTISEMARRERAFHDAQPLTTRCEFCPWTFEGTAAEGRTAFAEHLAGQHPEIAKFRKRGKKSVNAEAEWRAARAQEDAQRAALEALDAGEPQPVAPDPAELAGEEAVNEAVESGAAANYGDPERASSPANPYGLKKLGRGYVWPRETALEAIQAFAREHGYPPTTADCREAPLGTLPAPQTLIRIFDSFANAIVAAGFPRPTQGGSHRPRKPKDASRTANGSGNALHGEPARDEQEPAAMGIVAAPPRLLTRHALDDVRVERERQERKCGERRAEGLAWMTCADPAMPDGDKLAVLVEEVGEVARELCEARAAGTAPGPNLRVELVQVAAVCVAWAESLASAEQIGIEAA